MAKAKKEKKKSSSVKKSGGRSRAVVTYKKKYRRRNPSGFNSLGSILSGIEEPLLLTASFKGVEMLNNKVFGASILKLKPKSSGEYSEAEKKDPKNYDKNYSSIFFPAGVAFALKMFGEKLFGKKVNEYLSNGAFMKVFDNAFTLVFMSEQEKAGIVGALATGDLWTLQGLGNGAPSYYQTIDLNAPADETLPIMNMSGLGGNQESAYLLPVA